MLYNNTDAVDLLNEVYSFKDPESWTRPPVIEREINGDFRHEKETVFKTGWAIRSNGAVPPEYYQFKWKNFGKYALNVKFTKPFRLENWHQQYAFTEDKLKLTWIMDFPAQAGVSVLLQKKEGERYK